ncbi:MAG: glutamine amidotransferase [Acidobacteriota bacterium]
MFEFFFKYPRTLFNQGSFVFLNAWPLWMLWAGVALAAVGFGFLVWRKAGPANPIRSALVWLLQTGLAALLLFMLWHPALSVATLKPQQNIVAVVIDDSSSMAAADEAAGSTRKDRAIKVLNDGLLEKLKEKFQVRVYRMSDHLAKIDTLDQLSAQAPATHIGASLRQVVAEASGLPIGAMVLLSDGADNAGGVDLETLAEVRRQRIPVHTIGLGKEQTERDIEISNVELPQRVLPESRLSALVAFHQHGFTGQKAKITIRDNNKVLAAQEVTLKADGSEQMEAVLFNAGPAGVKTIQTYIDPLPNESNTRNNIVTRMVNVDKRKPRILYLEGEPRWEFKFIRRGVEDDETIDLVTILRTAPNKLYRQGVKNADELKDGFPSTPEELFAFDGLMFGSVDAAYLTPKQLGLVKDFVDRRGGGLVFLGGKDALADGGWQATPVHEVMPTTLPDRKGTFQWTPANVRLTPQGSDSLITRLVDDPKKNDKRFSDLPYIRNVQNVGVPKLGAVVLAEAVPMNGGGGALPLLITMNYGRGRTAIFATSGSWRWQMLQEVADKSHEMFYQQFLRWVVSDTPRPVTGSTPRTLLSDESAAKLRATVKDKAFLPANDAVVEAHIIGQGVTETVTMTPDSAEPGAFVADWQAPKQGDYLVEVIARRGEQELGRDAFTLRREDGTAENFHVEQNRELLSKLSSETKGNYYKPDDAQRLGEDITYSEGGISVRETRDLWDMPAIFLAFLGIRAVEWLLRRKWGTI